MKTLPKPFIRILQIIYSILLLTGFPNHECLSQIDVLSKSTMYKGAILDCAPITAVMDTTAYPLLTQSDDFIFSIRSDYHVYCIPDSLSANKIQLFSDVANLNLYAINDSTFVRGKESRARGGLKTINISSDDAYRYIIIAGSPGSNLSRRYTLSLCSEATIDPILNEKNVLRIRGDLDKQKRNLSTGFTRFNGQKSLIVDLEDYTNQNNTTDWLVVSVKSQDFYPYVRFYDAQGSFIKNDTYGTKSKKSRLAIKHTSNIRYAVITAYRDHDLSQEKSYDFELSIDTKFYDPEGSVWDMALSFSKVPFLGIIIGVLSTVLIGYIFRTNTKKDKVLGYEELTDKKIIYADNDNLENNSAELEIQGVSTSRCCLYEFEFMNVGRKRIDGRSFIKEDLKLKLVNAKKIVFLQSVAKSPGIKKANQISDTEIQVDFDFIDVQESILIRAICEIDSTYLGKGIIPVVSGKVAEATLVEKNTLGKKVFLFYSILGALLGVSIIATMVEILFDAQLPYFLDLYLKLSFRYIYPLFLIIAIVTPSLRNGLISFYKFPITYLKMAMEKRKAKKS